MVILGAPAAGKTVLALLFVLALLDEPVADQPVPVLLTASSWNPRLEHLHSWLARKLVEEYPALGDQRSYGPDAAVRLVTEGRIMPVIDGLDEMPAALHGIAIDALDRATTGSHPLVVTCRTDEYEAAVRDQGAILSRAAVMEIKPVDLADAGRFLTANWSQARQRWQQVLAGLGDKPDMPLARALTSPLMVTLARTVYAPTTTTPGELRDEHMFADWTAIERHLLGSFIPAAYTEQPAPPVLGSKLVAAGRGRYRPNQAWVWLRFLAWHLDKLDTRDLAWWELPRAVPLITRALLAGLTSGLIGAVAGYVADGAATSLLFGLAFAVATATSQAFGRVSRPSHLELRFRGTAPRFLARFAIGYGAGVAAGLAFGLDRHIALAAAVVPGLALASHAWWNTPTDASRASTPGKVLRSERTSALALGLVVAVAFGVITGLIYGSAAGVAFGTEETILAGLATLIATGTVGYLRYGLVGGVAYGLAGWVIAGLTAASPYHGPISNETLLGLAYGIAFGAAIGYNIVLSRAWGRYQLARYWLALRGHLPWRLTSFLGDAHQRGVLRQAGGMYQFRHALLQDHLAESG
jgi:hypothetical protein